MEGSAMHILKAITTKYHGPTNTKGSKVSAVDGDGNRVRLGWDNTLNGTENHHAAAIALCDKMGWKGELIGGAIKVGYVWVFAPKS
jgi:hypothetical protein